MMPAELSPRASPGATGIDCTLPSGLRRFSPLAMVPIHRLPWVSCRNDMTRESPMELLTPVIASTGVTAPVSPSNSCRPPPWLPIQILLAGPSAKAVTILSCSQGGRWPPSSQLRGFQRLTPPSRVPIQIRPA